MMEGCELDLTKLFVIIWRESGLTNFEGYGSMTNEEKFTDYEENK